MVDTHGHLQCRRCGQVKTPCCEGSPNALPTCQTKSLRSPSRTEAEACREDQGSTPDGAEGQGEQGRWQGCPSPGWQSEEFVTEQPPGSE